MSAPILATKLYIPPPRSKVVLRPRLIERLNEGLRRKLTLISAPAGFGKTTLVSAWIADRQRPVAWLSLDEGDNDPTRFLTGLIAALQTIAPNVGKGAQIALQSKPPPSAESILTILLNEITTLPDHFILVLDDYHLIDAKSVDDTLTFLIEHQLPQMHLVIATREDPRLPLAQLRVRDQLTELRASDLRFTCSETAEFLNQAMGMNLSAQDITALETRTEGWIAGLQLAALSMQRREDITSFIQAFTGSHRFVLDYLVEQVLQHQSEPIRNFLLETAILDRFCAPLCNAVTEREDGKEMLDVLERSNLFLIPLDDQREWYRYHHLFADVLQARLREAKSDQISTLHRRASVWFGQNDLPADAIRHALAAKDLERAAELIERVWLAMDLNYQYETWLGWVKALPDEMIRARPVVSVGYAWALLGIGEFDGVESRLRDAERWLELADQPPVDSSDTNCPEPSPRMVVADEAEFQSLPASIAAARAYRALTSGDIAGTKMYARQTLTLVPDEITPHRTQATALLALAEYTSGNLQTAEQEFLKFQAMMWQVNDIASAIGITFVLANINLVRGRLREAVSTYRQSLQLAASRGAPSFLGASDLHRGLGELLCEQGDLEAAAQHLRTAQQLGERGATTGWSHRICVAQARLKESQGDLDGALVLLEEAERQFVRNPLPDRPIAALKAQTRIRQGRLTEALSWVREQNLSPDGDLSYSREFEHLTLARVLIARSKIERADSDLHAALGLLARLLQAAEEGGRIGSVIEILIVQSLAQAQGNPPRALGSLERALTLAEPEGYLRIFVDEGEPMRLLISDFRHLHLQQAQGLQVAERLAGIEKPSRGQDNRLMGYADKILAAFPPVDLSTRKSETLAPHVTVPELRHSHAGVRNLKSEIPFEPLSERELQVLWLLRSESSGPEIAQQLVVSLNTLRTHTKSIFNKLGVNNRRAAVHRAEELDLF